MKVHIACTYPGDSMLSHQNCSMSIVEQVPGEQWKLRDKFGRNFSLSFCGNENCKTGRTEQRGDELPGNHRLPRGPHYARVSSHTHKFKQDWAGGRFLYASCDAKAQVDEISVSSSGQLALIGTVPSPGSGTELSSLTMSTDGAFVFGTEEEANSVVSFAVNQSSGTLTPAGTIAAGTRPNQAAVDVNNHFLYATNGSSNVGKNDFYPGSNNVSEYAVSKGVMTPLPDSPKTVGSRPASVVSVAF